MNKKLYFAFLLTMIVGGVFLFFFTRPKTVPFVPAPFAIEKNVLPKKVVEKPESAALPGEKLYRDEVLRYGFAYPEGLTLGRCQEGTCFSLSDASHTLSVLTLGSSAFAPTPGTGLRKSSLFCPTPKTGVAIKCTTTKVTAFTNANGTKGYAVERNKSMNNTTATSATVYVFPFTREMKSTDGASEAGVVFETGDGSELDPIAMKALVESVFVY